MIIKYVYSTYSPSFFPYRRTNVLYSVFYEASWRLVHDNVISLVGIFVKRTLANKINFSKHNMGDKPFSTVADRGNGGQPACPGK
jgi:hypothetical protein